MAVTYVGGDQADATAGSTTLTFSSYPSTQADDIGIIVMYNDQDLYTHSIGTATGWAMLTEQLTSGGRDMHTSVWWKRLTSSESTPVPTKSNSAEEFSATVHIFRGVDTVFDLKFTQLNAQNLPDNTAENLPGAITSDHDSAAGLYVLCCSHDDIVTPGTPTGFTQGEYITGSTKDFRQQTGAYDLDLGTAGSKSPAAFAHDQNNSVAEYHGYWIVLENNQPIHLTLTEGTKFNWSDTNQAAPGDGFEATQGTGKIEIWSDLAGTTKVAQSVDTWSDTSIQFDLVQGGLVDGINYLVVTNDSGDESNKVKIIVGFGPYEPWLVAGMEADHFWKMDNSYADEARREGVDRPFGQNQVGPPDFVNTAICRTGSYSFRIDSATERTEVADSQWTNVTNTHTNRNIGGWVRFENLQQTPACVYEEGGGVNNIYLLMLPNGRLMANVADSNGSPDFKVQAYSDFALATGRPYCVNIAFTAGTSFRLWIDGVEQTLTSNESSLSDTTMSTHSGDWTFGDPDANLDTGGVDIAYNAAPTTLYAYWGTWCNSGGGNSPLTTAEIRDELFKAGALAEHTIDSDTQANMQLDIDDYDSQTHADTPLTYDIEDVTGGGDLELTIIDQVWPDQTSMHARWLGSGTLTIRNSGTSNFSTSKIHTPNSGTVQVIETANVKVTVQDIVTKAAIQNARVKIVADSGGTYPAEESVTGITRSGSTATVTHTAHGLKTGDTVLIKGARQQEYNNDHVITVTGVNTYTYTVSGSPTTPATGTITSTFVVLNALTNASGEVEQEIDFSSNQPILGKIRKASASPFYLEAALSGTVTGDGFDGTVLMISNSLQDL